MSAITLAEPTIERWLDPSAPEQTRNHKRMSDLTAEEWDRYKAWRLTGLVEHMYTRRELLTRFPTRMCRRLGSDIAGWELGLLDDRRKFYVLAGTKGGQSVPVQTGSDDGVRVRSFLLESRVSVFDVRDDTEYLVIDLETLLLDATLSRWRSEEKAAMLS